MAFKVEITWMDALKSNREADYHSRYERAVERALEEVKDPQLHENVIGGRRTKDRNTFKKVSPIDRDLVLGTFQQGTAEDVDRAVKAAQVAFRLWSELDYVERVEVFERAVQLFQRAKFELAAALTLDNGKDRHEAIADVDEAINFMSYYANQMRVNDGFQVVLPSAYGDESSVSLLRPYGPWSVICPFNFPVAISIGMSSAAMLTGNTVLIKPSTAAPFALHKAFELLEQAGLPPGVANYIAGSGKEVGSALVSHPGIEGISFTGSRQVGFEIMRASLLDRPRPVIAEMGSKNPVIVARSADLEKAAQGIIASAFGFGGQKCSACSRVLIHSSLKEELEARLVRMARALRVKDPRERDCSFGPVIEERKVREYLEAASKGAADGRVLTGGKRLTDGDLERGNYVEPMIVSNLPREHEILSKELFLPILVTLPFDEIEEALAIANSSAYGLTAGIFAEDEAERELFFRDIRSGVVYANRSKGASTAAIVGSQSFTGWKASGSTGKGTGGPYYLQQFMREQTRTTEW